MNDFEVNRYGFLYCDSEYFEWFRAQANNNGNEELLSRVLKWKKLNPWGGDNWINGVIEQVWDQQNGGIQVAEAEDYPPTTRAFLCHLEKPIVFPILDRNVFAAMRALDAAYAEQTNQVITDWGRDYDQGYRQFFSGFYNKNEQEIEEMQAPALEDINPEIIRRRILDRALWEYGRAIIHEGL